MYSSFIFGLTILLFLSNSYAYHYADEIKEKSKHPDVGLKVPDLITKYGYPVETHPVITEDGYILTMHRIPHGKNNADEVNKPVIFLQHGLLCSSADWVLMSPSQGLAYLLADRGYDVWMGNARGNTYSRKHIKLNPDLDKKEFWDFSWHEIGKFDLPAMIDHVLNTTGSDKTFYIGHSQGTTSFFVMTSERPEYNNKIRLMIALAPVAFMEYLPNVALRMVQQFSGVMTWITEMLGANEFLPSTKFIQVLGQILCNDESSLNGICNNILFLIAGYDKAQLNQTMLPVVISNTPAGASTKQIVHYAQLYTSKEFQQYDYGKKTNQKIYGSNKPPKYDLSKISAPVAMYYGLNDLLAAEKDVMRLHNSLPHNILTRKVDYPQFSHLDFLWSIDVIKLVYNNVFDILSRYN